LVLLEGKWERATRTKPSISILTPANTNAVRDGNEESSTTAATTIIHPANINRKPAIFKANPE
jgi:hypothetical protein